MTSGTEPLAPLLTVVFCSGGTEAGYVLWSLDGKQLVKIDAHALRNRHGIGTDGKPFTVTHPRPKLLSE